MMPPLPHPQGLSIRTFRICNGQGFGLAQAIRVTWIGGFDLMILTNTNINNQDYCRNRLGYDVVCSQAITTADGDTQEGVGLVVWY